LEVKYYYYKGYRDKLDTLIGNKDSLRIDLRFLNKPQRLKFEKSKKDFFIEAYEKTLDCLLKTSDLNYYPNVYIIPFVPIQISESGEDVYHKVFYNCGFWDPEDFSRFAMFPTLSFIKRLPQKYVSASIAHELAHVICYKNLNNSYLKYIKMFLKEGYLSQDIMKEKDATSYYNQFKDPVKSWLFEWDRVKNGKENEVLRGSQIIDYDVLPFYVMGEKVDQFFHIKTAEMESLLRAEK